MTGKKSYIAGIGLLVLQKQNNKGETNLTTKRNSSVLETRKFKIKDHLGTPSDKTSLVQRSPSSSCVFTLSFFFLYVCWREEVWQGKRMEEMETERKGSRAKRYRRALYYMSYVPSL